MGTLVDAYCLGADPYEQDFLQVTLARMEMVFGYSSHSYTFMCIMVLEAWHSIGSHII